MADDENSRGKISRRDFLKKASLLAGGAAVGATAFWAGDSVIRSGETAKKVELKVLNPRGETEPSPLMVISPRIDSLAGKKIGLVDNTKTGAIYFFDGLEKEIKTRFPSAIVLRFRKKGYAIDEPSLYKEVADKSDCFVLAIGD